MSILNDREEISGPTKINKLTKTFTKEEFIDHNSQNVRKITMKIVLIP